MLNGFMRLKTDLRIEFDLEAIALFSKHFKAVRVSIYDRSTI
jgi:hypothetical protein